jgi:Phosphodiester glycosidase
MTIFCRGLALTNPFTSIQVTDETIITLVMLLSITVVGVTTFFALKFRRRWLRLLLAPITSIAFISALIAGGLFWYTHRPVPANTQRILFQGVEYIRDVRVGPVIIHVVKIDLSAPGIGFMVTPHTPTDGWVLAGRTTSQFLSEFDLQLAINGDFFDPWRDYGLWDYYPHVGDPVNVRGLSASNGDVYTEGYNPPSSYATLYISDDNQVSFNQPIGKIYNAISGNMMLMIDGVPEPVDEVNSYLSQPHPRTAIALDKSEQTLIIVLVDGRQPNYSEGVTMPELIAIVQDYDGYNALNLDGGGSVTLAVEGADGSPIVLNSPIHSRIPGLERIIANHLGVFANPIGG